MRRQGGRPRCEDQLFVAINMAGKAVVGDRFAEGIAYPGAKPSMLVSASDPEVEDRVRDLIRVTTAKAEEAEARGAYRPERT